MTRAWSHSLIWLAFVIAASAFCVARFEITTDIAEFLPEPESRQQAQITREIATGDLSRRMILTAGVDSDARAAEVSRLIEASIAENRELSARLESISGGPAEGTDEAIWNIYHPRRLGFVATTADGARAAATDESLDQAAEKLLRTLEQPLSALITRLAPSDPLLIIPSLFERFGASQAGSIRLVDDRFVSAQDHYAVVFLKTSASAFDTDAQMIVLDELQKVFDEVRDQSHFDVNIEMSGVNRFAVMAQQSIERDIRRITTVSIIALSLLLLLLFRSLRIVLLTSVPVVTGVLAGLAVTLFVFGRIHGVTLAFGAALIGVAVDYVVHLYCHHIVVPRDEDPHEAVRTIWPTLLLGAATTMTGFAALAFSAFSGLKEVAIFALSGLLAALLTTRFVVPTWMSTKVRDVPLRSALLRIIARQHRRLIDQRAFGYGLLAISLIVTAVAIPNVKLSTNLVEMGELSADLIIEEEAVRARVSRFDQTRFIVARGETEEEALQVNDRVADTLRDNALANQFSNVQALLPSAKRQQDVIQAFKNSERLDERFRVAFSARGFREGAFEPFRLALAGPDAGPVTYSMLASSELSSIVDTFRLTLEGDVAFITYLHGVEDPTQLAETIDAIPGATVLDQNRILSEAGARYQRRTIELLGVGMLCILVLLFVRYRAWRPVAAALTPSLLAVGVTLAALTALGEPVDLVVLTALLMIVSMGVDYGVFLVDGANHGENDVNAALMSILVAGLSTLLGFGLLALSDYPILFRIGLTAAIGISAAMILAPVSLTFLLRNDT